MINFQYAKDKRAFQTLQWLISMGIQVSVAAFYYIISDTYW